jgi:hypothetical protein
MILAVRWLRNGLGCVIKRSVPNKDFLCNGDFSFVSFLFVVEKEKKNRMNRSDCLNECHTGLHVRKRPFAALDLLVLFYHEKSTIMKIFQVFKTAMKHSALFLTFGSTVFVKKNGGSRRKLACKFGSAVFGSRCISDSLINLNNSS